MQPASTWLSSHSAWRSDYLKQIEAVEPHADRGSPIVEARRRWFRRMERLFKRPVFRSKKAGHGTVFRHSTKELRPLPVAEQVIGALACGWAGRNQQRIGHGGYPLDAGALVICWFGAATASPTKGRGDFVSSSRGIGVGPLHPSKAPPPASATRRLWGATGWLIEGRHHHPLCLEMMAQGC
jgi:hypothetical protein